MRVVYSFTMGLSTVVDGNYTMEMPSEIAAYPLYGNDLTKEYAADGDRFSFREKLTGSLTFVGPDFERISAMALDEIMLVNVYKSNDGGNSKDIYFRGFFTKTDCELDYDDRRATVSISTVDDYTEIINGLSKEFDLVQLAPEVSQISITKRPLLQIYALGDTKMTCYQGSSSWEIDASVVESPYEILDYHFKLASRNREVVVEGVSAAVDGLYIGVAENADGTIQSTLEGTLTKVGDPYFYIVYKYTYSSGYYFPDIRLYNKNFLIAENENKDIGALGELDLIRLGSGTAHIDMQDFYSRLLTDVDSVLGDATASLPQNDIVEDKGYRRVLAWAPSSAVYSSKTFSVEPTEWGKSEGQEIYFDKPTNISGQIAPVGRSLWRLTSYWFATPSEWVATERAARRNYTLQHTYPLYSVLQRLLAKVAPKVNFAPDRLHSEFLYGQTGGYIKTDVWELFFAPKTNVVNGDYSTPARRAPITLQEVFDMLRNVYQVYWFVKDGELRLEHVEYFRLGGTYEDESVDVVDLVVAHNPRSGKSWADGQSTVTYDKEDMPERYEFKWMDEATEKFVGQPIDILSPAVERGNVESVTIAKFSSDIDYIMMHPSAISSEGFVLIAAANGELPIVEVQGVELQNGYASLAYAIPKYWIYDLPNKKVRINGEEMVLARSKKSAKQTVSFPSLDDVDPLTLVRTHIGDGQIVELSVNLLSRKIQATLSYED